MITAGLEGLSAIAADKEHTKETLEILNGVQGRKTGEFQTIIPFSSISPLFAQLSEKREKETQIIDNETQLAEQGIVEFTEQEIKQMPKKIQRLIIIDSKRCRLRTRESGKKSFTYQIRFRRQGYEINACGKTIELAKLNFIEKAKTARPKEKRSTQIPTTFNAFSLYYFDNFRAEKVSPKTMKTDKQRYDQYLFPYFKEKGIKKITPSDCKTIIDKVKRAGKGKTADELYSLLSVIFKSAIAHGIIDRSPLATVQHIQHERQNGTALTKNEEQTLLSKINALNEPNTSVAIALALFCGLRPNELKTAKIRGNFIIAENSKRHNKKKEYKRIPIIARLRPFLKDGIPELPTPQILRRRVSAALPNHKLYDLRTTFYTRCQEYGVSDRARNHFVGHASGRLESAYTDLSDEYLLKEAEKLNEW